MDHFAESAGKVDKATLCRYIQNQQTSRVNSKLSVNRHRCQRRAKRSGLLVLETLHRRGEQTAVQVGLEKAVGVAGLLEGQKAFDAVFVAHAL